VLVYYGSSNLAALRLLPEARRFPRWVDWVGLVSCFERAFFIEPSVLLPGLGLLPAGLLWRTVALRRTSP